MSTSNDYESNYKIIPTPSPGCDYQSLLNDSESFDLSNLDQYHPVDTEKRESSELQKLKSQNLFLQAQLELITKEKELHIKANAQNKIRIEKDLQYLKNTLETQLAQVRQENAVLLAQNKDLNKKLQKFKMKTEKISFYKHQLEKVETHYSILLGDKDRTISMLKSELGNRKVKKTGTKKKTASLRGSVLSCDLSSPKFKSNNFGVKVKNHELDDISQLIVKLEKEQAELKESKTVSERESFNYQSLKEMGERNKERFEKLQTQHMTHLKNRLSSEF